MKSSTLAQPHLNWTRLKDHGGFILTSLSSASRNTPVPGWQQGTGWGWIWGPDDEIGALNAMTPESIREALAGVTMGQTHDLGLVVDGRSYVNPFHPRTIVTTYRTAGQFKRAEELDRSQISFNTSLVAISDHAGTQIDGLCHATFGEDDHFYNGFTHASSHTDFGSTRASVSNMPPIVLGAVLIDVAGHLGVEQLDPHFAIGPELLAETLEKQATDLAPGEAVFVRTGVLRHWREVGQDHERLARFDSAGLTLSATRWLIEDRGAILVGSDTSSVEVSPAVDGEHFSPVHHYLLVEQGVHMGELHNLEALAASRTFRFCYVALTPKVRGTTGGFAMRPIALV